MRVLALSGKRFSGKDTFAAALVRHGLAIGVEVVPHAFAAESKRLLVARQAELGVAVDLERLTTDRSYKEQWRSKLTELTVAAIAADPLVFCRAVADRIDRQTKPHVVPLVTDVRLLLEVTHLRARFDLWLVRIARGEEARARSGWLPDPSADAHRGIFMVGVLKGDSGARGDISGPSRNEGTRSTRVDSSPRSHVQADAGMQCGAVRQGGLLAGGRE